MHYDLHTYACCSFPIFQAKHTSAYSAANSPMYIYAARTRRRFARPDLDSATMYPGSGPGKGGTMEVGLSLLQQGKNVQLHMIRPSMDKPNVSMLS
ncbi:hypothetical protein EON63_07580 [archaeon]|nr:MAG: hypothetical protein EON63_07580 [archaeon]